MAISPTNLRISSLSLADLNILYKTSIENPAITATKARTTINRD